MALTAKSQFLYGLEVNSYNQNLSFSIGAGTLSGSLTYGYYTLEDLVIEVVRVLTQLAPSKTFTYSINRTSTGPFVTITCSSGTFSLFFASPSSIGPTLGYAAVSYTGSLSYTAPSTCGTILETTREGYTYLGPEFQRQVMGAVNVSATGLKEAVVFQVMQFVQAEFKHEPQAKVITDWTPFFNWAIQQRPFEFTPSIADPTTVYQVTLEKTAVDGKGLGFKITEMLPEFPFYYKTGLITMRRQFGTQYII